MGNREEYIKNHTFCECFACKSTNHVIETRVGNLVNDVRVADVKNDESRASHTMKNDEEVNTTTTEESR